MLRVFLFFICGRAGGCGHWWECRSYTGPSDTSEGSWAQGSAQSLDFRSSTWIFFVHPVTAWCLLGWLQTDTSIRTPAGFATSVSLFPVTRMPGSLIHAPWRGAAVICRRRALRWLWLIRRLFPKCRTQTTRACWSWEYFIHVPVKPDEKSLLIREYFPGDRAVCPVTPEAGSCTEMDAIGFFCLPEPIVFFLTHTLSDTLFIRWLWCHQLKLRPRAISVGLTDDASQTFQNLRGGLLSRLID